MPPTNAPKLDLTLESVEHEGEGYNSEKSFQDSLILIKWTYTINSIDFTLQNRSNKTIKVIWEEASFIDEKGEAKRVMHQGVKYIDRDNAQPPTSVIRGATLNDTISPTDKAFYMSGQYGGWYSRPIFEVSSWSSSGTEKIYDELRGKKVSILLPIMSEGRTRDYIYTFVIK